MFSVLTLINCAKQPEGFTITGNVEGFADSTLLYLQNPDTQTKIDSSLVIGGKFQFKGILEYPNALFIMEKSVNRTRPTYTSFWVENSNITVTGTKEEFRFVKVEGSESQKIADILRNKTRSFEEKSMIHSDSLMQKYKSAAPRGEIDQIRDEMKTIRSQMKEIQIDFVKEYTNSYAALQYLYFLKTDIPRDTLQLLYDKLESKFKNSIFAEPITIYLNSKLVDVDDDYADFDAKTFEGKSVKFSDFVKEKYVLLDFWSTGCGPCRSANKHMSEHYDEVKDYLEVVSFSMDKNKEYMEIGIKEDDIKWNVISNMKGYQGEVPITYQVMGIPTFFLISPEGKIVKKYVGFNQERFDEILAIAKGEK